MALASSPVMHSPGFSPMESTARARKRPASGGITSSTKRRLFGREFVPPPGAPFEQTCKTTGPAPVLAELVSHEISDDTNRPFEEGDRALDLRWEAPDAIARTRSRIASDTSSKPECDGRLDACPESLHRVQAESTAGKQFVLRLRERQPSISYQHLVAQRSTVDPGRATNSFYGIDIHKILEEARSKPAPSTRATSPSLPKSSIEQVSGPLRPRMRLWTEKYRARKFTDLVGDEKIHRTVLGWLKSWDSVVFPDRPKPNAKKSISESFADNNRSQRKILLLTGPPGLGKTTLAHVCARQAGYEVLEINASDERSREVVKGRIRDSVGTENVRGKNVKIGESTVRKAGRPVCVVVDEVDGAAGSAQAGGEGGFMKALVDLVLLDQRNASSSAGTGTSAKRKQRGDNFRLLRPMILICNDVYHPSLRPLRSSNLAEIVHVRKPPLDKVIARMKTVFRREGLDSDDDAVRRLCEATWGISSGRKGNRTISSPSEGDMRGILVAGEWAATKFRSMAGLNSSKTRLTRLWVEKNIAPDLASATAAVQGLGRGGTKEAVDRIFINGAGFAKTIKPNDEAQQQRECEFREGLSSFADSAKGAAMNMLRQMLEACGESDRIVSDLFTAYPSKPFQDDTFLSKPNAAHEWLHFHDTLSTKVFSSQEWELNPYLSQAALAFHYHFASSCGPLWDDAVTVEGNKSSRSENDGTIDDETANPFGGPRADFAAFEAQKRSQGSLEDLRSSLSISLRRSFRALDDISTELVPYLNQITSPQVSPVIVGGSADQKGMASVRRAGERAMVERAVEAMGATGVCLERSKIEDSWGGYSGYVYRMEPPIDSLATFETAKTSAGLAAGTHRTRYAVRQVLDQELQKFRKQQMEQARQARFAAGGVFGAMGETADKENQDPSGTADNKTIVAKSSPMMKRDFFGRIVTNEEKKGRHLESQNDNAKKNGGGKTRVWVTYHEGFSNAVRKPISLAELMGGF